MLDMHAHAIGVGTQTYMYIGTAGLIMSAMPSQKSRYIHIFEQL